MSSTISYLKQYKEYLELKNYSSGTISIYLNTLRIFFDYCKEYCDASIDYQEYARRYILHLQSRGLSWSTTNIQYSSLKLFCVKIKRDLFWTPFLNIPKASIPKNFVRIIFIFYLRQLLSFLLREFLLSFFIYYCFYNKFN